MLDTISQGFSKAKSLLSGQTVLTEQNIDSALQEVRHSLLEADVSYDVALSFLEKVKTKALDKTVSIKTVDKAGRRVKVSPHEHFVKICFEELIQLMGPKDSGINLENNISTIMMVGLQGTGKTTTTGKLAKYLLKQNRRPMLVAADIYRPAAVEQLKILGQSLGVPVYSVPNVEPAALCRDALVKAKEWNRDTVLFDTAGRLSIDDALMAELEQIKALTNPENIFLVVDAMVGQDAVLSAKIFNERLAVDGFILTKLDGDTRGGAALSIKAVTQKPIKFLGNGEGLKNLEEFRPEGLASRILDMGDIVSLVQDFEEHVDKNKAEKDAERLLKGKFTLQDFLDQMSVLKKMGPLKSIAERLPGMGEMLSNKSLDDREFIKFESIVKSMTFQERNYPELFQKQQNRKLRVANGAGRKKNDVDVLLKRFTMMQSMFKTVGKKPGLLSKLPGFDQLSKLGGMATQGQNPLGLGGLGQMPFGNQQQGYSGAQGLVKSAKQKKAQRLRAKKARKKNKKRK